MKDSDEPECEIKMFFDDDIVQKNTSQNDQKPKFVIKDHFTQENESSLRSSILVNKQQEQNMKQSSNSNMDNRSIASNDDDDRFSDIAEDKNAIYKRKMMKNMTTGNFTQSEIIRRPSQNYEDNNQQNRPSDFLSRSSLNSSLLSTSNSSISGTASDSIQIDLNKYNINIFDEKSFQKGPECSVCKQKFAWFSLRQHHCRFCSLSCCQLCSEKRINKQRACDACFVKLALLSNQCTDDSRVSTFQSLFEYQKEFENLLKEQNSTMIKQRDHLEETIENLASQSWKMSNSAKENVVIQEEQLIAKKKTLQTQENDLTHLKQNISYLKGVSLSKQQHLEEKTKILFELQSKLNRQKEDNYMKKQVLDQKIKKQESLQEKVTQISGRNERLDSSRTSSILSIGSIIDSNHFSTKQKNDIVSSAYNPLNDRPEFVQNAPLSEKEKASLAYSFNPLRMSISEQKNHKVVPNSNNNNYYINQSDNIN